MGLFDKFKTPKWKDKNYTVRLNAVKELDDQEILKDIAKEEPNPVIMITAMRKITDENFINNMAENSYSAKRMQAIHAVKNQKVLLKIAKNDNEQLIRKKAYAIAFRSSVERNLPNYMEIGQEFYKNFPEDIRAISAMLYISYKEEIPETGRFMHEYQNAYNDMLLNGSSGMNEINMELQDWYLDLGTLIYKKLS